MEPKLSVDLMRMLRKVRNSLKLNGKISVVSDLPRILETGSTGVGLYRTEFPFFIRAAFPSEMEQADAYSKVVKRMEGGPVTFRTLDVGGDKPLPYLPINEENPQLGWRSIRVSFDMDQPFRDPASGAYVHDAHCGACGLSCEGAMPMPRMMSRGLALQPLL